MASQTPTKRLTTSFAWVLSLVLCACNFGIWLPTTLDTELTTSSPLRGSAGDVRTLAIALPSTIEILTGVSDPSRGKLDPVALEIAERMPKSGQLALVQISEFHAALSRSKPPDFRVGSSMTETQWKDFLLKGARAVNADGVVLLHGSWDSPLNRGQTPFGRGEYRRQVGMSVITTRTGETLWSQQATVNVRQGISFASEENVRTAAVAPLVRNLLDTLR